MPAFVFVSGYFSSFVTDNRKSILKLFIAYVIFNYFMMLYAGYVQGMPFQFFEPYYSYWYLLALIAWRLMGTSIMDNKWIFPFSLVLALLVGFWNDINNTLALSRIIGFWPFYIAGYKISKIDVDKVLAKKDSYINIVWGLLGIAFLFYATIILNEITFNDLLWYPYETYMGVFNRIAMTVISFAMIVYFLKITPKKKVPLLSVWGKNSLAIFVLHRYFLFALALLFMVVNMSSYFYTALLLMSIFTMFLTGNDRVGSLFNYLLDYLYKSIFSKKNNKRPIAAFVIVSFVVLILIIPVLTHSKLGLETQDERGLLRTGTEDLIHPVLSYEQKEVIDNAVSIAFVGDLILLQDQVREAWCSDRQQPDFDPVFEYAKPYLQKADYAIGVLEGPLAGEEVGYSTSNYDDGIPMYLNFPDSFAESIARSGINLVTLANNHLLDKGVEGAMRTLDYLDQMPLDYTGAYRNVYEKEAVKIVEVKGLKLAVLSYTFPSNYYTEKYFFEENTHITSILVDKNSPYFRHSVEQVKADFIRAKSKNPDFIIILPHMGTQFIHETDEFQELWNDIFIQNGADIVLTAHSHSVQPIEYRTIENDNQAKTAIIVNCPGNFANSFIDYNGDATAIVKVYLDPENKSVIGAGVIPMWTHALVNSLHRALPIYDIIYNPALENQISRFEMNRVDEVQRLVTSVLLKTEVPLHQSQKIYYLFPEGYYRQRTPKLELTEEIMKTEIYQLLEGNKKVSFVGDSITEGSKNGGYGWFEPLAESIEGLSYNQKAWPGATSVTLLDNIEEIYSQETDIYVIAIGVNDIRYRDKNICAMTSEEYINNIDKLVKYILSNNVHADFVFVAPWPVLPNDPYCFLMPDEKENLMEIYAEELENYCSENGFLFVNPYGLISRVLNTEIASNYLIDHIHPNASDGIKLYSMSVFLCDQSVLPSVIFTESIDIR